MDERGTNDGASPNHDQGILANLPRTRPQRASARRAAARGAASRAPARGDGGSRNRSAATRARRATGARARHSSPRQGAVAPASAAASIPMQGFESDSEAATGSVAPPGAVDLLASAAGLVGELAKGGVSRSERIVRDLVSRLPLT